MKLFEFACLVKSQRSPCALVKKRAEENVVELASSEPAYYAAEPMTFCVCVFLSRHIPKTTFN